MPGESLPWKLIKFYNELINEMSQTMAMENAVEEEQIGVESQADFMSLETETKKPRRKLSLLGNKSRKRVKKSAGGSMTIKSSLRGSTHRGVRSENFNDLTDVDSDAGDWKESSILEETVVEFPPLPTDDPEEIQQLLFRRFS